MTPMHREPITGPMAWRGSDFRGKDDIAFDLTAAHRGALEEVLAGIKRSGVALGDIGREHGAHPALDRDLQGVFEEIQHGRGIVIMRGIPVEGKSIEDVGKLYWAIGAHFGLGVSQSALGDLLGQVRDETLPGADQSARGYLSRRELSLHTDLAAIVGLLCVRSAREGGFSQYASGLAIHNEIRAARPDLLEVLYRGFHYHRRGEEPAHHAPITPYRVPAFSKVGDDVSVFHVREIAAVAMRDMNRDYTAEEKEAIDLFEATARRVQFETRLEAGEATFLNNYTQLHARSEFVDHDDPAQKRLMLRLWLDVPGGRQVVPEIHVYENADGRSGSDHQPGRLPAQPTYTLQRDAERRQAAAD